MTTADFPEESQNRGPMRAAGDDDLIDIRALWRVLRRRMWVIAGTVALICGITLLVVFQLTPLYTASALVLIDPREERVVDLEAVMSGLPPDSAAIDSEVEVLRSRKLASRVVEELELVNDPEFNPTLRDPSLLSTLNPLTWLRGRGETTSEQAAQAELNKVIDAFQDGLSVSRRGLTYVITVNFTSEDARKATTIANTTADLYVLEQLEAKYEATRKANEWLGGRLSELRAEVQAAEEAVEIYRAENDLLSTSGMTVTEQQLAQLNGQLIIARADLAESEAKFRRYQEVRRSGSGTESLADVLQSDVIADLRQQEAQVRRRLAELSSRYGDRHPEMIKVRAELRDLNAGIAQEVNRVLANIENEVEVARSRVASLRQSLEELQGQSGEGGLKEIKLRELESTADAVRMLYETFLQRFRQTSEQTSLQESDARVLSEASIPINPSYPSKTLFMALALVGSGMLGVGLAFLLEQLDDAFSTVRQLEETLGLPHLSTVPDATGDVDGKAIKMPSDVILKRPLSAYSEAFRALRSGLTLSDVDNPPKVVVITSALPGDGKTTTALSLARAARTAGQNVILLDCDLRRPTVHKTFGTTPTAGIVECLAGQATLEEALMQDPASGLPYLPVKSGAANPPDLLGSRHMAELLGRLRETYDLVVIDSAPVLPVVDSRVLSAQADKVVFVVKWRDTPRDAAANAVRDLRDHGASLAGVVFEQVDLKRHQRYGYGDSSYYYGRYSKYYVN